MNKRETFALLKMISVFYDQFSFDQEKVNLWYDAVKDLTFVDMEENLLKHVRQSPFPPKVSELYIKPSVPGVVPDPDETRVITTRHYVPATSEVVQKELANIRKVLGIEREQQDGTI
ncbi:replicative helicase loader/inhibitor [Neobacillus niacini]|uniref:replicative helicase loader/inhibitor n=1 Tax=Neobacillus niacini TaxID=86668 RepID=UPI0021CB74A0|nr:replicative helicase loader/inhibitor [Neobacillus niacini]MCM3768285.1 replicative helicase loader/inhibitor [Neobacillus niacini]